MRQILFSAEAFAASTGVRLCLQRLSISDHVEITDFYADEPGMGNGTKALKNLTDLADEYRFSLFLHPESERAKKFFLKHGFERRSMPTYDFARVERHPK